MRVNEVIRMATYSSKPDILTRRERGMGGCTDTEKRPREDTVSHLQAKERGLKRSQSGQHLDLELPASRTMRKFISVV